MSLAPLCLLFLLSLYSLFTKNLNQLLKHFKTFKSQLGFSRIMEPDAMRRIDYWLGIPICFFLTILYKLQRLVGLKNPRYNEKPKNILFIELAEMGSTVLAHPAMKKLKSIYPSANIHFLLFEHISESAGIIKINKENVFTINSKNVFTLAFDTLKFMIDTRRKK